MSDYIILNNSVILDNSFAGTDKPRKRVAIVDDFAGAEKDYSVDINGDGKPELHHGLMVEAALRAGNTTTPEIVRKQSVFTPESLNKQCMDILSLNTDNNPDNDIDCVNLSQSHNTMLKPIRDAKGYVVDFDKKVDRHKIKSTLEKFFPAENTYMKTLEKLSKTAKVYMSAGNDKLSLNSYNAADGVISVGGEKSPGKPHPGSAENSLVDEWAPFEFEGKLIKGPGKEPLGYDVYPKGEKGDGLPELFFGEMEGQIKLTGNNPPPNKINFDGTSFSSPYKLNKNI